MKRIITLITIGLLALSIDAQCLYETHSLAGKSEFLPTIIDYLEQVKESSPVYSGERYIAEGWDNDQHPYFLNNEWNEGSLVYDEVFYPKVFLRYDLVKDQLIATYDFAVATILEQDRVSSFELGGYEFVKPQELKEEAVSAYYELRYCGEFPLLKQWKKNRIEINQYPIVKVTFESKNQLLLQKDQQLQKVRSKTSFLSLFPAQKDSFKKIIKERKLFVSGSNEKSFIQLLTYYGETI